MTEDADRQEMQQLLAFANFSKVAEAVGVERAAVANWARGRHVTPRRLEQVRALYGLPVGSQGTTKESPPAWAEGLESRIAQEVVNLLAAPEQVEAANRPWLVLMAVVIATPVNYLGWVMALGAARLAVSYGSVTRNQNTATR